MEILSFVLSFLIVKVQKFAHFYTIIYAYEKHNTNIFFIKTCIKYKITIIKLSKNNLQTITDKLDLMILAENNKLV